jgi:hypothetical protein
MKLQNGYKVLYEVAADGKRTFYASKTGVFADAEQIGEPIEIGKYKLVYEKDGKIYFSETKVPNLDENGKPTDTVAEGFDTLFVKDNDVTGEGTSGVVVEFAVRIGDSEYKTLAEAVEAAENGQTLEVLADGAGSGVVVNKSITIDFGGHTYTFTDPAVGSTGTETNGFQLLKGNDIVLKNGALNIADTDKDKFYILVQNYSNLTVEDMVLDGTNLDKWSTTDGDSYVLSNNCGTVNVTGKTSIVANEDGDKAFAFDVCKYSTYKAPIVNVSTTGKIVGKIEVTDSIANNLNISSGTYTVEIQEAWCADGYAPVANEDGTYGVKAKN